MMRESNRDDEWLRALQRQDARPSLNCMRTTQCSSQAKASKAERLSTLMRARFITIRRVAGGTLQQDKLVAAL